jgi:uncharacterized membrane protein
MRLESRVQSLTSRPGSLVYAVLGLLALVEGAFLMQGILRAWLAVLIVAGGMGAAIVASLLIPERLLLLATGAGLLLPWVILYAAFWAQVAGDNASMSVFCLGLAIPFATAGLAALGGVRSITRRSLLGTGVVAGIALGIGVVAAGARATWLNDPRPPARFELIDEVAGTYGGVGIGDTPAEMRAVFGPIEALGGEDSFRPTGAQDYSEGPWSIPAGGGFAYEDVLFWLPPDASTPAGEPGSIGLISGFEVTSPGARTLRGVEMGDHLDDAKKAYPTLKCEEADRGEYGKTRYCTGGVAPQRFLFFGADATTSTITSITVSRGRVY